MARNESVLTALYLHPVIRGWLESRARIDGETMSGILRRLLREHIKEVDPSGWEKIEAVLKAEIAGADQEDNGVVAAEVS